MKRMKKLFAVLLTMAMVMGLGITSFAANGTAQIKVSGLASTGTNTVTYYRILEPAAVEKGYKFVDGVDIGFESVDAFLKAGEDAQKKAIDAAKTAEKPTLGTAIPGTVEGETFTADVEAGLYAVYVENTGSEKAIVYTNPMIVSVDYKNITSTGDGKYEYDANTDSKHNEVVAKYTTIPTIKEATDSDKAVEIGRDEEYTIKTYVPSGDITSYKIEDKLTGATYKKDTVTVTIGGKTVDLATNEVTVVDNTMTIDLFKHIDGKAGQLVEIKYEVTITDKVVSNEVKPNDGKHKFDPVVEKLYTGNITLTKVDAEDTNIKLADAGFKVQNITEGSENKGKWATFDADNKFSGWVDSESGATEIFTAGKEGTVTVSGLDKGIYSFKETTAPAGYSINTNTVDITLNYAGDKATAEFSATDQMTDTTLHALPSTGGMGTTLFTIGGCAVMICAAGLFFASRKKSN